MKTYCISDIHGHLDNLNRFIKTLDKDDVVYVLGDVIDKGPKPIECLKQIMEDKRFHMLLGNHEYMMFQMLIEEKGTYEYRSAHEQWIGWNCGNDTYKPYMKLPKYEQIRIMSFIRELPLNIPSLKVGDREFYLVHSCPNSNVQLRMSDVSFDDDIIVSYVWDRVTPSTKLNIDNKIVVAGHTFVHEYLGINAPEVRPVYNDSSIEKADYIDIDGGLATKLPNSRLIALCLDDLTYQLY